MGASASGEATSHEVDDDMCVMKPNEAEHLAAGDGVPVSRGVTILFLKKILANEKSVRAAFEPVALSAGCSNSGVERLPFLRALTRVSMHFNPAENVLMPTFAEGPLYSREEAYHYFREALHLLTEKLEKAMEHNRLSGLLKASRMRVKQLQLTLECEEGLVREGSDRVTNLGNVLHELEEQEQRLNKPVKGGVKAFSSGDDNMLRAFSSGDDNMHMSHDVMTLEDLKQLMSVSQSLKYRVIELEKTLDEREDRVTYLLKELKKRRK